MFWTLECPVRGRAHPDKLLFQKWCQEVDVEEVLTATLPNEPVSGDEELDVLSTPLFASPPGKEVKKKEVQSSYSEVDLFAPPPTWTLALLYIKRLSRHMERVESGTRLANMKWCRRHIFVVTSDDKEGLHWFVCAFNCRVRLELFTIGWSCGFQSLNIPKLVVEHRGTFSDVPLVPMGAGFVDYVLSIVNADRAVRVIQAPGDDVEGVTDLPGPRESDPSTQVEGALSAIEESVQATPTPLKGNAARKLPGQQGYRLRQWHSYMGSLTNIKLQYGWWAILLD